SRRKPKKVSAPQEPALDIQQQQRNDDDPIHTVGSGLHISMDNSRASSIMFPSKSVATDPSSDEEPYFKYGNTLSPLSASRHSSSVSLTHLRTAAASTAKQQSQRQLASASGARLERGFLSLSHTNLHQASLSAKKSRVPSPLVQSASNSLTGRMNNFTSEPATPATQHNNHRTFLSNTNNPSLASMASVTSQRLSRNVSSPSRKYLLADETPGGTNSEAVSAQYLEFLSAPASFISHGPPIINPTAANSDGGSRVNVRVVNDAECELADGKPAGLPKLELREMRNTTKAELKLVIDSCAYYADKGDVQTAVTVALLMRNFIKLSRWKVAERWFASYIELLDLHMAFAPATDIILASPFESVKEELLSNIFINLSCSQCGSALSYVADMGFTRCVECQRKANSCVVCEQPTDGRFIWCQGCGHGGHAEHISDWFGVRKQQMCPSGCGHACQPVLSTEYA
ncbi:SEA (Seh1-associated) complex subunit, partial [Coemansia sp. RSA 2607]